MSCGKKPVFRNVTAPPGTWCVLKLGLPTVGVAQLVERWIVVPVAEGSNPSTHPTLNDLGVLMITVP